MSFILGIVPGDVTKGHIHYPQPIAPLLAPASAPSAPSQTLREASSSATIAKMKSAP